MQIKEYRITLPLTVQEYQIAQLFTIAETMKQQTDCGEVVTLKKEPFHDYPLLSNSQYSSGEYTSKIHQWSPNIPPFLKRISPKSFMDVYEEAWDAYPYSRTVITNPRYKKDNFHIRIDSLHLPDRGDKENVHQLPPELLQKREVINIDIASDMSMDKDYRSDEDPAKFHSQTTGRGPLIGKSWQQSCAPVMTCYKLVVCEFNRFGLQKSIESFIQNLERRLFTIFHRQVFCWIDRWHDLTLEEAQSLEVNAIARVGGVSKGTKWQQIECEDNGAVLSDQRNDEFYPQGAVVGKMDEVTKID